VEFPGVRLCSGGPFKCSCVLLRRVAIRDLVDSWTPIDGNLCCLHSVMREILCVGRRFSILNVDVVLRGRSPSMVVILQP